MCSEHKKPTCVAYFFSGIFDRSKEQQLFKMEIFCNNVFTVTFGQFTAPLRNET